MDRSQKPLLKIVDNESLKKIKETTIKTGVTYQTVEPQKHRVNVANKEIQTLKTHFIVGLFCWKDPITSLILTVFIP